VTTVPETPLSIVRSFFEDVNTNGSEAAYRRWLDAGCLWKNSGRPDCHGVEEMLQLERESGAAIGYERWTAAFRGIAADGNLVLTDRVDALLTAAGEVMLEIEVMGALSVEGGRIVEWREYYDADRIRAAIAAAKSKTP
jgi:limonene-1,2-epoxide hydrolase